MQVQTKLTRSWWQFPFRLVLLPLGLAVYVLQVVVVLVALIPFAAVMVITLPFIPRRKKQRIETPSQKRRREFKQALLMLLALFVLFLIYQDEKLAIGEVPYLGHLNSQESFVFLLCLFCGIVIIGKILGYLHFPVRRFVMRSYYQAVYGAQWSIPRLIPPLHEVEIVQKEPRPTKPPKSTKTDTSPDEITIKPQEKKLEFDRRDQAPVKGLVAASPQNFSVNYIAGQLPEEMQAFIGKKF